MDDRRPDPDAPDRRPDPDVPDPLALDEYRPHWTAVLTDAERWPTMTPEAEGRLRALRHHPLAPAWTHATGDRLTADGIVRARTPLPLDGWLDEHLATARRLPAYRGYDGPLDALGDFPLLSRADLVDDVSAFVPLDADFDLMIHGSSSGTSGSALLIPDHVEDVARTFHLIVSLVRGAGRDWRPDPRRMALAQLVHQRQAFTYASLLSSFEFATMARVNLHPSQWRDTAQRDGFLRAQDPQVLTGNPTSLGDLLDPALVGALHPLAIVSGAMHLERPLREALHDAYGCPVIDVYGLHETRPIAASVDGGPLFVLDRRLVVEIVSPAGDVLGEGEFGEIVVTAGENPLLPLVRYRTGDFGRLLRVDGRPALADLEGREATVFLAGDGAAVPCVDLTQHLQTGGALGWSVAQELSGDVTATIVRGDADLIRRTLSLLLRRDVTVTRVDTPAGLGEGKPRRYRSDVDPGVQGAHGQFMA
ncbi:CoF synthetase [Frondihabitans australicus]|uniref:Phenylacetate-CoA ligase n=1 Tax=Frondihabitans australicus TaxID=386892 RepID=A0A495IE98_9MICO|nr:CoF synthetase [Frondihabitans australicus]RKR73828.1 phenylacetate-CoA ligase [Frondihabitans australicus]